jgi:hypothetical protein
MEHKMNKVYKSKSSTKRAAKAALLKAPKGSLITYSEDGLSFVIAEKVEDGILRKSTMEGACSLVWSIAEEMEGAKRKDIIAACVEKGVAFYTARTQYQKYSEVKRGIVK